MIYQFRTPGGARIHSGIYIPMQGWKTFCGLKWFNEVILNSKGKVCQSCRYQMQLMDKVGK